MIGKAHRRGPGALLLGGAALALLAGCADFLATREHRAQGWRAAQVVQIGTGALVTRAVSPDCRREATPEAAARTVYVVYRYQASRRPAYGAIALPADTPLTLGDLVEVNVEDCRRPPRARRHGAARIADL